MQYVLSITLYLEEMEHTMRVAVKKENGQNYIQISQSIILSLQFKVTAKLFMLGNIMVVLNKENGTQSSLK